MYAIIFADQHDETGADAVAATPVKTEPEPASSLRIRGESWTVMGVNPNKNDAEKYAKSLTVRNPNYARGFGKTPVRYVGIVL